MLNIAVKLVASSCFYCFYVKFLYFHVNQLAIFKRVYCHAGDNVPRTATNPEYFAGDRSSSKPPHNDYYNAQTAAGVSRTGSRFNESRV